MPIRNNRITPETEVRSPARSFVQALDNFYAPARDRRGEAGLQGGLQSLSGIFEAKAAATKNTRNQNERLQGIEDAMREQAGKELQGVKNGSIWRQNSTFYMAGLNETRGKAAGSEFKNNLLLEYNDWDGRFIDDDGSAYRDWANAKVSEFMDTLGDDPNKLNGALPLISEITANLAHQHTASTNLRLQDESFNAHDTVLFGFFDDFNRGTLTEEAAIARIVSEADDLHQTDGAEANDRTVTAAIQYATSRTDPEPLLLLAKAHDSGQLPLSASNQLRLDNAMDGVQADLERQAAAKSKMESEAVLEARRVAVGEAAVFFQDTPYADLPRFKAGDDWTTHKAIVATKEIFMDAAEAVNPQLAASNMVILTAEIASTSTYEDGVAVLAQHIKDKPNSLTPAQARSFIDGLIYRVSPSSLFKQEVVQQAGKNLAETLYNLQVGDGMNFDVSSSFKTEGMGHWNHFITLSANSGVDTNSAQSMADFVKAGREYVLDRMAESHPETFDERFEQSAEDGNTGTTVRDAAGAIDRRNTSAAEASAAKYAAQAAAATNPEYDPTAAQAASEGGTQQGPAQPASTQAPRASDSTVAGSGTIEGEPAPYDDPKSTEEYSEPKQAFYSQLLSNLTDGEDGRDRLATVQEILLDDPKFKSAVDTTAANLNLRPDVLLAVMNFETKGTLSAGIKNEAGSGATGLIQFMPKTAVSLGTTTAALAKMTRTEQLSYVEKYLKQFNLKGGSVEDVYMAILWPKAIGKPRGYPLFKRPSIAYTQNAGLDTNGDGTITKFEAAARVTSDYYGY